jgi:MFS family permease
LIITLSATMIGDYFSGSLRARWLATISTTASLSAVAFFAVGGAIGAAYGWRAVTTIYGLSILFVPAMLLLTWEPKRQPTPESTSAVAMAAEPEFFPWNHMMITGLSTLFGGILFYSLAIQQGLALAALGVQDPGRLGLLTAVASLANPIGTLVFWRMSHWRPTVLLAIEFAIVGGACSAIGFVQTDVQFATAAFVGLFGCGLLFPTLINWTMAGLPASGRARGTGIFQSMFMFSQFASGMLLAFLTASVTGSLLKSFGILGAAGLIVALYCLIRLRSTRPAQPVAA